MCLQNKFNWGEEDFTNFQAFWTMSMVIGQFGLTPLLQKLFQLRFVLKQNQISVGTNSYFHTNTNTNNIRQQGFRRIRIWILFGFWKTIRIYSNSVNYSNIWIYSNIWSKYFRYYTKMYRFPLGQLKISIFQLKYNYQNENHKESTFDFHCGKSRLELKINKNPPKSLKKKP